MKPAADSRHLHVGALIFPRLDQTDFTGPFEVLARLPNATFHVVGRDLAPVRDEKGLILTPEVAMADAPALDVLIVPGGPGQEALMDDEPVRDFLRLQAAGALAVLSVCTGALLCGAAGLLRGRRCTTHWASFHLLACFGGLPVDERVVVDGNLMTTAGVTAGIDGALRLAAALRGDAVAQRIQLSMEYAPDPPFASGSPKTAPAEVVAAARAAGRDLVAARQVTAERLAREFDWKN